MHCVFFFGTHNYAWIMETDLKPYLEFKETLNRDKKSGNFKKAIDEIEEFLAGKGNFKTSAGTQVQIFCFCYVKQLESQFKTFFN